jgi:hypothetical protein
MSSAVVRIPTWGFCHDPVEPNSPTSFVLRHDLPSFAKPVDETAPGPLVASNLSRAFKRSALLPPNRRLLPLGASMSFRRFIS